MQKKYIVRLTDVERETLREVVEEAQRLFAESATGAGFVESRRGGSRMDRQTNRRGIRLPHQDGGEHSRAVGDRGF